MLMKLIRSIIPYGIYEIIHRKRHKNFFLEEFDDYIKQVRKIDNPNTNDIIDNNFKQIVSVQGLGFSGSGAILDLLCEVDDCYVMGKDENAIVIGNDHKGAFEVEFLRLAGGLFELEKYIDSDNIFQNDAMANRFISCINAFPLFQNDRKVRVIFYDFFESILDLEISDVVGTPFNPYLYDRIDTCHIFFFKKMSISSFRLQCKKLLLRLFNYLNSDKKSYIVLDQFLQDNTLDISKFHDYVPDSKIILCYRDPRDVYQFALDNNIGWIAHDNADHFVKWYKQLTRNVNINAKEYLVIQFENLVFDYENQVEKILSFLDISKKAHNPSLKRTFFNPDISKQNIGLWKKEGNQQTDFKYILSQLKDYCYFETN